MDYIIKRSNRKSVCIQVTKNAELLVRAPMRMKDKDIQHFVDAHRVWIEQSIEKQRQYIENHPEPTDEMLASMTKQAKETIPPRVEYFASVMGLSPAGITITRAKTRFGSCSTKSRLCFSCLLMAFPPEAIDYVVVHELAHIVHKNHSKDFHSLVASVLPDHKLRRKMLKFSPIP